MGGKLMFLHYINANCTCVTEVFGKTCLKSAIFKIQKWFKYKNRVELNFQTNGLAC